MGLTGKNVKSKDFESFSQSVSQQIGSVTKNLDKLAGIVTSLLPPQEEDVTVDTSIVDLRSNKDKAYEDNLTALSNQVAKEGVKLVQISGRYGPETHNMTEMAAKTIMNIQREKNLYKTRV
jgi:hypothetical protein